MNFTSENTSKETFGFKEISTMTGVKPYVLRFWETEFEQISPQIDSHGHKTYSKADSQAIAQIKELLFEQKLSIPEAKAELDRVVEEPVQEEEIQEELPVLNLRDERIFSYESSLDLMKKSLKQDFDNYQAPAAASKTSMNVDYSEKDMLALLHAKKKLKSALGKIDQLSQGYHW